MVRRTENGQVGIRSWTLTVALVGTAALLGLTVADARGDETVRATTLLDLSGLAWVEGDLFLGIHDAKDNPEKQDWPRVSLLSLPTSELHGVVWRPVDLTFPGPEGRASDMESVCRIPNGEGFLFCESGQEGPDDRRIFHAVMQADRLKIKSYITWPVPIANVEATEVCQVGKHLLFLYAERADSQRSTRLRWAKLSLAPLKIGPFEEVTYQAVDPVGKGARPLVALDIDSDGLIYIASAFDSGRDDGPYRSVVWRIGKVTTDTTGGPRVELGNARRLATLDGLKVESVAVRELAGSRKQVFIGTDDEHFGGILRLLP